MKAVYTSEVATIYETDDGFLVVMYGNELRCETFEEAYQLVMKLTRR